MVKRLAAAAVAAFALAAPAEAAYFDVGKLPKPPVTGKQLVDEIDAFSTSFTGRVTGTPIEMNAATFLRDSAAALGYEAAIVDLPVHNSAPVDRGLRVVTATRKGLTKPDEHLLFIGHYDVLPQSVSGHYDNGSGTLMINALARALAALPTNRTVTFAWYNGEEEGALASDVHAQQFEEAGHKVRAVLGFDMVGLSYPVANPEADVTCLCMWWGDEDEGFEGLLRHVNHEVLGFPDEEGLVQVVGPNDRNSDEASWDAAGYPTLRWAGMRNAGDYPQYHMPEDNLATMVEVAGSRENLEQGMYNTLLSAYSTALALDNEMPVPKATAAGEGRTIAFDGSGSSDPDGPVGSYTWDFGDGTGATGAQTQHTYARPGTYQARLTVADNLHPGVTATQIVPVTVAGSPAAVPSKPTCKQRARALKGSKRRAAMRKCAKKACRAKARRIGKKGKRKAALRRCGRKR